MSFGQPSKPTIATRPRNTSESVAALGRQAQAGIAGAAKETDGLLESAPPVARRLAFLASFGLGAVLPILMVVANKSAPATLGVAALCANLAACLAGLGPELGRRYLAVLGSLTTAVIASFVIICLCSLAWSVDPAFTRRGLVEALPELAFALAAAAAWPLVARRQDFRWLIVGILGAAFLIVFENRLGMPLHALVRARGEAWDLKRSAIPPVLLLWPALAFCLLDGKRSLALALAAAAALGVVFSHSGAPGFALIASVAVLALGRAAPKAALWVATLVTLLLIGLAPWTGTLASRFLSNDVEAALREEHAAHRLQIWSAFEDRVQDHPIMGHGFDASFKVSQAARPDGRPPGPDNKAMLDNHPHNIFLELWVELGLLGAVAAAGICAYMVGRLARLDAAALAPRLALLTSVVGIGLVGLSAWQPWWLATIAAALLWFDLLARRFDA